VGGGWGAAAARWALSQAGPACCLRLHVVYTKIFRENFRENVAKNYFRILAKNMREFRLGENQI